jgi:hypothetical protein
LLLLLLLLQVLFVPWGRKLLYKQTQAPAEPAAATHPTTAC